MTIPLKRYFDEVCGPGPTRACDLRAPLTRDCSTPSFLQLLSQEERIAALVEDAIATAERLDEENAG